MFPGRVTVFPDATTLFADVITIAADLAIGHHRGPLSGSCKQGIRNNLLNPCYNAVYNPRPQQLVGMLLVCEIQHSISRVDSNFHIV